DIWGLPGGQTFLPGVPCLVFEGQGGAISYLEPAMCRYFAPVIQATKARLMKLATPRDAEFDLRSAPVEVCNLILLLARYVGIRVDSGDIASQCVLYFERMKAAGVTPRTIVLENEVTPELVREVYDQFRKHTGEEPTLLFPGAGGYWWRLVHCDTLSAAFKRS